MNPLLFLVTFIIVVSASDVKDLQIGVKYRPEECSKKAEAGDTVSVHYAGALTDGTEFDNSFSRGRPITFKLGSKQVIEGWEKGILGACEGEKRKLKIPSSMGYGETGAPPRIPGGATLVFDIEIVEIVKSKAS